MKIYPVHGDRNKDVNTYDQGDVIHYEADGFAWSARELANPLWRIVRVALTEAEAEALVAGEQDPADIKAFTRMRQRTVNPREFTATRELPIQAITGAQGLAKFKRAVTENEQGDDQQ